jgi:hypothetical protein
MQRGSQAQRLCEAAPMLGKRPHSDLSHVVVLIPVYNDWEALGMLLQRLDAVLAESGLPVEVLVVDDASTAPCPPEIWGPVFKAISAIEVLALRSNLGHQRAVAIGLTYVDENSSCQAVVVMDSDGEDAAEDVPRLIHELQRTRGTQIVFAERTRRSEGLAFCLGYRAYRMLHYLLTGKRVRVGNFSIVPRPSLHRLTAVSELWNHYAAAVLKARIPYGTIPTHRANRLSGRSKMSLVSLVVHGLSALSVYSEVIGVRMLVATMSLVGLALLSLSGVALIRLTTDLAVPGWASNLGGQLLALLVQLSTISLPFVFLILQGRSGAGFLPARDYLYYIDRVIPIALAPAAAPPQMSFAEVG